MNRKAFSFLVATAVFCAVFTSQMGTAAAVDFVYSQSGGFLLGSATFGPGVGNPIGGVEFFGLQVAAPGPPPGPAPAGTYAQIGWGCNTAQTDCAANGVILAPAPIGNDNRSALGITDLFGTITQAEISAGTWNDLTLLTHQNNPITGNFLTAVDISTILRIGLAPTGVPPALTDPDVVHVGFTETVNLTTASACPPPNPNGTACDDFFTFDPGILTPLSFTFPAIGGTQYTVEFRILPLAGTVLIGNQVFTGEDATNTLLVQLRILQVPEPATLLLLGSALLGSVGFTALRRRQTKTS